MLSQHLLQQISRELNLDIRQINGALELFDEGATLPFVARYRKEATGGLDEVQLASIRDRGEYLEELEDRRTAVLKSIDEQGKLTPELRAKIIAADTKQTLEDLYLPFRPKRRTRASIARERGLEPLADLMWSGSADDAAALASASSFLRDDVETAEAALQGARDIIAERLAEDAIVRGRVRELTRERGIVASRVTSGKEIEGAKFRDYFDFQQKLAEIPSHRMLAIRRGEGEEVLSWSVDAPADELTAIVRAHATRDRQALQQLSTAAEDAYRRLLAPSIEVELRMELKTRADEEAIAIFGRNLEQLLLASPAGERVVIGLDPGFRTGVKVAVVSRTGAVLETTALYLHQSESFATGLQRLIAKHKPDLIAIGNGTASRETEEAVRTTLGDAAGPPAVVVVNEAGASVYSASDVAREELPDLDVSLRGAASIARRLQDPLAELVKIDPKSIGVGQYQHDVNQTRLKKRLDEIVEICVNRVGVELNTASVSLLSYVAGVGAGMARNIVIERDKRGGFSSRRELLGVPRFGAKAFEQSAGFLRIRGGKNPLDASAVHPERYTLVQKIADDLGRPIAELIGDESVVAAIPLKKYVSNDVGLPTLQDIAAELKKPGRDPRAAFEPPAFRADVREPKDLVPGMQLEGVVTNIVAFGAFVDIGVHQDGLVHISQLADRFVSDPNQVVQVGQRVKVSVMSVDLARNRIALTMKSDATGGQKTQSPQGEQKAPRSEKGSGRPTQPAPATPRPGQIAPNGIRFK